MKFFTGKEKEYYLQQLILKGRALFSQYGVRKTAVEDLTRAVGIAKGSFYLFFDSKESLFFRILTLEVRKCREENLRLVEEQRGDPYRMVKAFLANMLRMVDESPILRLALSEEGREAMARESIANDMKRGGEIKAGLDGVAASWLAEGLAVKRDPETLANLVRTLFLVSANRERFNGSHYGETLELLVDCIARGITGTRD